MLIADLVPGQNTRETAVVASAHLLAWQIPRRVGPTGRLLGVPADATAGAATAVGVGLEEGVVGRRPRGSGLPPA